MCWGNKHKGDITLLTVLYQMVKLDIRNKDIKKLEGIMKRWTCFLRFFQIVSLSLILPISFFIILSAAIVEAEEGDFVWARAMGGTLRDSGRSISVDTAGNVYTIGYFSGTVDFDPGAGTFNLTSAGGSDIFVSKLDRSGNLVWAKAMGGTSEDFGFGISVDTSGNVYTTGFFYGTADFDPGIGTFNLTSAGNTDIFISKLDSSGNFGWAKVMGGSSVDQSGYAISVDPSGNLYTTGNFSGTADFDPGPGTFNLTSAGGSDIFVSKLDSSGNFVWAKAMGGAYSEGGHKISVDSYGNVYTTGNFSSTADFDPGIGTFNLTSAGNTDIFISKLDSSGNFVWAKAMGGSLNEYGYAISVDTSGNIYTTGNFSSGTVDFDPGAGVFNLTSAGNTDIFISKLDSSGNLVWAKAMGGSLNESGYAISVDPSGNLYTTGNFSGTADFDSGIGTFNLTSAGDGDIFISKLDSSGNFVWAKAMGGAYSEGGNSIFVDTFGNVYTTGHLYSGTADFDPGVGTFNLTSAGDGDIFISKLDGQYNLTTSVTGGHGSLSPPSGNYGEGTVVDLTATPDAGYRVAAWSGTDDDSLAITGNYVTLDSDKTVTVQFEMISVVGKFPWAMFLPAIIKKTK
jgi:hypothetical protein